MLELWIRGADWIDRRYGTEAARLYFALTTWLAGSLVIVAIIALIYLVGG